EMGLPQGHPSHGGEEAGEEEAQRDEPAPAQLRGDAHDQQEQVPPEQPAEEPVVLGVEVPLDGEGLGKQDELVDGWGFHVDGSPGCPMLSCRLVERDAQNPRTSQIVAEALRKADRGLVLVVTGAGVSAASGLPLFRGTDPDAIWNREVTEIGTVDFFRRDPVAWWQWFRQSFAGLLDARPNPAHHALAALERWQLARGGADAGSDFLLVTQNVDTLHEQAGSKRLVKVHGTADRLRCSRPGCRLGAPGGSFPAAEADFARFDETPAR